MYLNPIRFVGEGNPTFGNSSAKANFAFADEFFKVGGRHVRRQRQILPLPTNLSRSGVGTFVGKGKICLRQRILQGRGSAHSSAKAKFAFADESFQVGGRHIRRQRQNLPSPTNFSRRRQRQNLPSTTNLARSGVGTFFRV